MRAAVKVRQASTPAMKVGKQMMSRVTGLLSQTLCMVCQAPQAPPGKETLQTVSPGGTMSSACPFQRRYTAVTADMNVFVEEDEIVLSVQSLGAREPSYMCPKQTVQMLHGCLWKNSQVSTDILLHHCNFVI